MAYSNAIFYIDLYGGGVGDSVRPTLTNVIASNPSGSITRMTKTAHGLVNGAVVTTSLFTTWLNGDWKIENVTTDTFDLVGAVWQATADASGSVVPFGGSSWADAWTTITSGATAARIAPGDTIRVSKTPDPVSIGNASWTDCPAGGFNPTTVNIASSTNATPIEITTSANHNLVTGDVALIYGHTTNYTANGNWIITYVSPTKFTLDNSVGVGVGATDGTIRKVNSKAVVLATAQTQNVVTTEGGWTATGDTSFLYNTTWAKSGRYPTYLSLDALPQTSTLQAYKAIPSTDFSSKQKLSFWLYNSSAIVANNWKICLCSDTAGTTIVDTFHIPAIPSINRGVILSIAKFGGGNLGNAIQSVAVYTNTVAPTASSAIRLDNFQACTTNGLQGNSLISKNGTARGGTETFYGIQSINGKVVILDNDTNTISTAGRGYSGTTETVITYIRNPFPFTPVSSTNGALITINDSGTLNNNIVYDFGYEIGTTNANGETYIDGLVGNGYGISHSVKTYVTIKNISVVRCYAGLAYSNSHNNLLEGYCNFNNFTLYGIYYTSSYNNIVNAEAFHIKNGGSNGVYFGTCSNNRLTGTFYMGNGGPVDFGTGTFNTLKGTISCTNNPSYALNFGTTSNNIITGVTTKNNGSGAVSNGGDNYIKNSLLEDSVECGTTTYADRILWSYDHDQTVSNHWGFFYGGSFNWQTTTKHDTEAGSWKTSVTTSILNEALKAKLKICEVGGVQNTNLTIKAWVKKDHATNIASRLVCYADTVLNITEQAATKANDTNWEELSITLNSSHPNPVFSVYLETWYVAGTSNSYVGKITAT